MYCHQKAAANNFQLFTILFFKLHYKILRLIGLELLLFNLRESTIFLDTVLKYRLNIIFLCDLKTASHIVI